METLIEYAKKLWSYPLVKSFVKNIGITVAIILGFTVPLFAAILILAAVVSGSLGWFIVGAVTLVLSLAAVSTAIQRTM